MVAPLPKPSPHVSSSGSSPAQAHPAGGLAAGWALICEAGDALALAAQLGPEVSPLAPRDFAMRAATAGPVRIALVEQAVDDCAAALQYGLNAMIAANGQGRDCTAAALTLWREFTRARDGLLALTAPLA